MNREEQNEIQNTIKHIEIGDDNKKNKKITKKIRKEFYTFAELKCVAVIVIFIVNIVMDMELHTFATKQNGERVRKIFFVETADKNR